MKLVSVGIDPNNIALETYVLPTALSRLDISYMIIGVIADYVSAELFD